MPVNEVAQVAAMPRGMNGTMSFVNGSSGGAMFVRIRRIAYAWEVVATESHACRVRAMYPHQRAISRFRVTLEFKGYREYKTFMDFMRNYIEQMFGATKRAIYVYSAVRNFQRWGIPVSGITDGDHVGQALFSPTIVFESINDPLDSEVMTLESGNVSRYNMAGSSGDDAKFFYPFSAGSRDTNVTPETFYDFKNNASLDDPYGVSGDPLANGIEGSAGANVDTTPRRGGGGTF